MAGAGAVILVCQLFLPPVVGLADQGDFARMIGRFGYGPEDRSPDAKYAFVATRYVPDPGFRLREWEQPGSEYLFVAPAVWINRIISRDGKLDIRMMGAIHVLVFLAILVWFQRVTRCLPAAPLLWLAALLIFTDVGYTAYWNSFYAEPASCLFVLLLVTETIALMQTTYGSPARWTLWAILLVTAKPQNAPLGLLLALLVPRLSGLPRNTRWPVNSLLIVSAAIFTVVTVPKPMNEAAAYNTLFLGILPESPHPAADLEAMGLSPEFVRYSGTGAWSPGTGFGEMVSAGIVGKTITPFATLRFYLTRPARIWRRTKVLLPVAFSLRPEWCGNYERSAGYAPGARSAAFAWWSGFHQRHLARGGKAILILLAISPVLSVAAWIRFREHRRAIECFGVLCLACLGSFLAAALGDAWDNVKHLFLFNLLLDVILLGVVSYTSMSLTTSPNTSVRRKSRPA